MTTPNTKPIKRPINKTIIKNDKVTSNIITPLLLAEQLLVNVAYVPLDDKSIVLEVLQFVIVLR